MPLFDSLFSGGGAEAPSNPFGRSLGASTPGNTGAITPMRSASGAPSGVAGPAALAGRTPFNPLMDPSQRGILGLIGKLSGAPTREQWMQEQALGSRAGGIKKLQELMTGGKSAQHALLEFVQTPEGQDMLLNDPDGLAQSIEFLKSSTPEAPKFSAIAPGHGVLNEATGQIGAGMQTTPEQEFRAFSEIAGLDKETMAELAMLQLGKMTGQDPTLKEKALDLLVKTGRISTDTAAMMAADLVEIGKEPVNGRYVIINKATNEVQFVGDAPSRAPQPGDPDYAPGLSEDGGTDQTVLDGLVGNPEDIVDGVGMGPAIAEFGGGIAGQFIPKLAAEQAVARRRKLDAIRADAQAIRDLGSGSGRSFSADVGLINNVLGSFGWNKSPIDATVGLLTWQEYLEGLREQQTAIAADDSQPIDVVGAAYRNIKEIERAMSNIPPRDRLEAKLKALQEGSGPMVDAIKEVPGLIKDAEEGAAAATGGGVQEFKDEAEAQAAGAAGKFKAGDTIIIGGKRVKVGVAGGQ